MKQLLFLFIAVSFLGCKAQIWFADTDSQSKEVLMGLYHHLLEAPTDTSQLKDTAGTLFRFYDQVVTEYFNKKEMTKVFEKFDYNPLLQYEILRGLDQRIDSLKADSIFVMSGKKFKEKYGEEIGQNMENAGRFIAGSLTPAGPPRGLLDISLDDKGKFIYLVPIIHFQ